MLTPSVAIHSVPTQGEGEGALPFFVRVISVHVITTHDHILSCSRRKLSSFSNASRYTSVCAARWLTR